MATPNTFPSWTVVVRSVGLPPGPRRRTPGLRREEVAQLSGIGITWYTWLEQGRAINVSVQVLDAVARTLSLDAAEKAHLYGLAGVPTVPVSHEDGELPPEMQTILDHLDPLGACVLSNRFDVLAWNEGYAALFPGCVDAERNTLWEMFTTPDCCNAFVSRTDERARMVAYLRSGYGRNLGDPRWSEFVDRLCAASPDFARMWARNDVASPATRTHVIRNAAIGEVSMVMTNFTLPAPAGAWVKVFTPTDGATADTLARLRAMTLEERRAPFLEHRQRYHAGLGATARSGDVSGS
ncbi:helix-turn-helix transcriptional regulator [Rhodococcus spelaei]|uniref:helix-turn-helix transcriptional regulator n=1 Tax=Rhodococcus spelaei TaxID=2546320 RepID=UPI001FEB0F44|nr:helix-turn-helix transcriptional regulator [Rhodococcus spelaei]